MNRADLAWALRAVLPHAAGGRNGVIGSEPLGNVTYFYATDHYTTGIARVNDYAGWCWQMSAKEATELMRFIRPERVADRAQEIVYVQLSQELHVGYGEGGQIEPVTAVFETVEHEVKLETLIGFISQLNDAPVEWDELIYQPKVFERFTQAEREKSGDRLRILPKHAIDRNGAAIVTVGSDFLGAIAGLTYDQEGPVN